MTIAKLHYEAVFISDLHLGNDFVDVELLKKFLQTIKEKTAALYLVGDVFDSWRHCKPAKFLEMFEGFNKIVFIMGNHDGAFAGAENPLNSPAIISEILCWNKINGIVTHAHLFDPHFENSSWWATLLDALIYKVSRLINYDLKESLGKIARDYSAKIEENSSLASEEFHGDFMIIGHTHYGGDRIVNGVRLFNLGSWLTEPFAFFKKGDSFVFKKIEENALLPSESDFKKFF